MSTESTECAYAWVCTTSLTDGNLSKCPFFFFCFSPSARSAWKRKKQHAALIVDVRFFFVLTLKHSSSLFFCICLCWPLNLCCHSYHYYCCSSCLTEGSKESAFTHVFNNTFFFCPTLFTHVITVIALLFLFFFFSLFFFIFVFFFLRLFAARRTRCWE